MVASGGWVAFLDTPEGPIILEISGRDEVWDKFRRRIEKHFGRGVEITWPADARKRFPEAMRSFELG